MAPMIRPSWGEIGGTLGGNPSSEDTRRLKSWRDRDAYGHLQPLKGYCRGVPRRTAQSDLAEVQPDIDSLAGRGQRH